MRFKKLELFGFKSFADKTSLEFEPGVTAIVGPNGCGKSNVVDAIRWVLGEQAPTELRFNRMEDAIFNGTDKKEPLGFAEVSLTLSNEDKILPIEYDEVNITRRLFRSGESQYLLNKTNVRLRDIAELFMGTGIGTSSYSIIGQGKIDLILSSRPEDRRKIFDEAAGITKYKSKKEEALRRLDQTQENLVRIRDIIAEVERQIRSIERLARKAERYKERFDALKELDSKYCAYKYQQLLKSREEINAQDTDVSGSTTRLSEDLRALKELVDNLRSESRSLEEELEKIREKRFRGEGEFERAGDRIANNKDRISEIDHLENNLVNELGGFETKSAQLDAQHKEAKERFDKLSGGEGEKKQALDEKRSLLEELARTLKESDQIIKEGKMRLVDLANTRTHLKNELAKLGANKHNLNTRLGRLSEDETKTETEFNDVEGKKIQAEENVNTLRSKLIELKENKEQLLIEHETINFSLKALQDTIRKTYGELNHKKSALEFLIDLAKKREGYSEGAKELLKIEEERGLGLSEPLRTVADLINVSGGVEHLLELALGDKVKSLVVANQEDSQRALDYLKENNLGRADIIILNQLAARGNREINGTEQASAYCATSDQFNALRDHLLGDVYITETLNDAQLILDKNPDINVVTRAGEVLAKGTISGGMLDEDALAGPLARKRKITECEKEINEFKRTISEYEQEEEHKKARISEIDSEVSSIDKSSHELDVELADKESNLTSITEEFNRLKEEVELLQLEVSELKAELEDLETDEKDKQEKLISAEGEEKALESEIANRQNLINQSSQKREALNIEVAQVETELAGLASRRSAQEEALAVITSSVTELNHSRGAKTSQLNVAREKRIELKTEIDNLTKRTSELETEIVSLKETEAQKSHLREEKTSKLMTSEEGLTNKQKELDEIRDQVRNIEVKKTELNYELEALKEKMLTSYKVDLNTYQFSFTGEESWEAIKEEVDELKHKVEAIGPVSSGAIDEHEELKERFEFLTQQEDDLKSAKEQLHQAILKINRTTRSLFAETFDKIQAEFRDFFRLLFGGGEARLEIMDTHDVLESGIEIIVRPPGKKLQSISLLSGGEKAMTAIALLFAIFKVKPSPFCILDEVDAPLDESNIDRFSQVLQEFLKSSQFIIITHNKKTIALADVMYGITMEESGVSKIVSVKFSEKVEEEKKKEAVEVAEEIASGEVPETEADPDPELQSP